MPSSTNRETRLSAKKPSMAGEERGGAAGALQPCEEQVLRSHVESAAAGKKNLSDSEMVELLCSTFPETYSRLDRTSLIDRVAKISPLPCRREDAMDEPTRKRQKTDETRNVDRQIEATRASASASYSGSNGRELDSSNSDESGSDESETRDDANGVNGAIVWDLSGWKELGVCKKEMSKNEKKWPMLRDLDGLRGLPDKLYRDVLAPLLQFKLLRHFGAKPTTSVLLHGPPGCGKTALARAIGNEAGVPFYETSAAALMPGVSGILELFCRAYRNAPSVVFIDELDALTSETESLWSCPVKQLMACMDELVNDDSDSESCNSGPGYVLLIGATNRPDALNPALKRQFHREYYIGIPDLCQRRDILSVLTRNTKVEVGFNFEKVARWTQGFVARDCVALVQEARMAAVNSTINKRLYAANREWGWHIQFEDCYKKTFSDEELENITLTMDNFAEACKKIPPSAQMEMFSTTPDKEWDDVGGLQWLKLEFENRVVKAIKFPRLYKDIFVSWSTMFFLYGPKGCGKALFVKALAKEAGASFVHCTASDLSYYGKKRDLMVHNIFNYARAHRPCIVLFDELDTSCGRRDQGERYNWAWPDYRQLVSAMIRTDLSTNDIYVIGASNKPEIVSHLPLIREEFERTLFVPLPTPEERGEILKTLARNKPIDADVDLMALGKDVACENFNASDLKKLMRGAAFLATDRPLSACGGRITIKDEDFRSALETVSPSLSCTEAAFWKLHAAMTDD